MSWICEDENNKDQWFYFDMEINKMVTMNGELKL